MPRDSLPDEQKQLLSGMLAARQFAKLETHFERWQRQYERGEIDDWALLDQYQAFYYDAAGRRSGPSRPCRVVEHDAPAGG